MNIYLEIGNRRVFASALEWPGWCRSGADEAAAQAALLAAVPRYTRALTTGGIDFSLPEGEALVVVERLKGGAGTDFGAPEAIPAWDEATVSVDELRRLQAILRGCWGMFDQVRRAANGKELRKGPRGGGRELEEIANHVIGAEAGYLSRVGKKLGLGTEPNEKSLEAQARRSVLEGLEYAAGSDYPAVGPRGGRRWPARYFARRVAWHVLDHAWEIEDRAE